MRPIRPLLFRLFYSTSFTIVFLLVIGFIAVTPADAIRQAWNDDRQWDIGVVAGIYVVTGLIAILIYSSRLYTNRSVLQGIPKPYVPIEKDDLPGKVVRRVIAEGLERSALVAYRAKPRFERIVDESPTASARIAALTGLGSKKEEAQAAWKHIAHPGWSSPASPDLSNLHFDTVIAELPNLIEAKAVSLAPTDPLFSSGTDENPLPDDRVVVILQRPLTMGMRDYVSLLDSLGLINPRALAPEFLRLYERARFSARPLDEVTFRDLMGIFASVLRGMTKLDPDFLAEVQNVELGLNYLDDDHSTHQTAWRTPDTWSRKSASTFSTDQVSSVRHHHPPRRVSEDSVPSLPTDPEEDTHHHEPDDEYEYAPSLYTAPLARHQIAGGNPRSAGGAEFQSQLEPGSGSHLRQDRTSTSCGLVSTSSHHSLRQTRSITSVKSKHSAASSQGSVIRLRDPGAKGGLPYTIKIPQSSEWGETGRESGR